MSTATLSAQDLLELTGMVRDVLTDLCPPDAIDDPTTPRRVWAALDEVGVTRLGLDEDRGGGGADLVAATDVLKVVGEHTAPGPLAETSLLGGWLLETAGLDQPPGPVTTGPGLLSATPEGAGWRVRGSLPRVPVLEADDLPTRVVALAETSDGRAVILLPPAGTAGIAHRIGRNLAGERRDRVEVDTVVPQVHPVAPTASVELELRGALSRATLAVGAMRRAQELSLRYAAERVQFGRPIGAFQAVQQQLAALVAEVATAEAAVEAAVQRAAQDGFVTPATALAVAVAKVRSADASTTVAAIAHQVHGAMGVTQEHPLRHATTRLWSWRSEWGSQSRWAERIADQADTATGAGLWALLTGVPTP